MSNFYRINVSKDGKYLFSTESSHIVTRERAESIYRLFVDKFPSSQGYEVTCLYWDCKGKDVNFD